MADNWPQSAPPQQPAPPPRNEHPVARAFGAAGFVLDAFRRRRAGRITLWALVIALTLSGSGLLAYPFLTSVYAGRVQGDLEERFDALEASSGPGGFNTKLIEGAALTRIKIPRLKVNAIVVEGVSADALHAGAGHLPRSALPGDPTGNVVIAGHRTGFKGFFRYINKLRTGDLVELTTPFGVYTYSVLAPFDGHRNPWVTVPTDLTVTHPTPEASVTLVTCDPPGSSKHRLIVRGRLVRSEPRV